MYESVYVGVSVKPLFALEFKNPIKSSTVPVHPDKWHTWCHFIFPALIPISLPAFPWTSSALVSHPASLFVKRVLPAVSFLVTRYLSLPVSFFLCRVPA